MTTHHDTPPTNRTCPCKKVPLSLSSFTAAEYGDLASLSKIGPSVATRRDAGGYTPLHFAAQQNHVSACCLLLNLGCPVDGGEGCGASPLHRASFSGSVGAMRVLIEWAKKERTGHDDQRLPLLLARDTSFGDQATPLHKAAAGGRFLAVQLLVDVLREMEDESSTRPSILRQALEMKDATNRTPIDVARYYATIQDTEQQAVARWDEIAGGKADWNKTVLILECAAPSFIQNHKSTTVVALSSSESKSTNQSHTLPNLPTHLIRDARSCLDCGFDDGGNCLTAKWELDFFSSLNQSADSTLSRAKVTLTSSKSIASIPLDLSIQNRIENTEQSKMDDFAANKSFSLDSACDNVSTTACMACQRSTVALYPQSDGTLVCKQCKRSRAIGNTTTTKVVTE